MLRKWKKSIAFVLFVTLSLGMKTTVLAAAPEEVPEDTMVINLFDPDDPNLIAIEDVSTEITARTTSRPTVHYNLDTMGSYAYSAYSNNNIMWTKYIFDTQDGEGGFVIHGDGTNMNYRLRVHNCDNGKGYIYRITNISWTCHNKNSDFTIYPSSFYFGIDTTASGAAVSVNGYTDTY